MPSNTQGNLPDPDHEPTTTITILQNHKQDNPMLGGNKFCFSYQPVPKSLKNINNNLTLSISLIMIQIPHIV
jgi:hypothetical protein